MGYIIIGIIGVVIIVGILKFVFSIIAAIFEFFLEHKAIGIAIISIIVILIYLCTSSHPFAFLGIWGYNIGAFLWRITYRNTIFDAILIYAILFLIAKGVAIALLRIYSKELYRNIICTVISVLVIVAICAMQIDIATIIMSIEIAISIVMLWRFIRKTKSKIGIVKDVTDSYVKIETPNLQIAFLGVIAVAGVIRYVNGIFETSIPVIVPVTIFDAVLLGLQIRCYRKIFKGYKFINGFVNKHALFCYDEYKDADELNYLTDQHEYASSVTDILRDKKRIFLMPFGDCVFINNQLYRVLEKKIKANISSGEIEQSVGIDFKEYGFERVYKTVFAWVKGYEIDFVEKDESKSSRKSGIGIGATEFVLMRYPIEKHPILNENNEIRTDYITALNGIVCMGDIDKNKWDAKVEEYCKVFGVTTIKEDIASSIDRFSDIIRRKDGRFKTVKSDYSYVLLLETIYFENLLTEEDIKYREIETIFEALKIDKRYRDFIYRYIKSMFIEGDIGTAEKLLKTNVKTNVLRVLEYIHHNIMWNEKYVASGQYNVAICATMSAGKSTFINAMLGTDYIPAKNEACTAKITTIRDNDNLEKIIGCYTRTDDSKVYSNIIDGEILNEWNEDTQVVETILEGDFEEISCSNGILVVHDTPGTNNSGDDSHHYKTIEFLKNTDLDLIIYLINAEYISTNDTEILLKEIQEIEKNKNTKIVFGLNKIDCFDEEGDENLETAIKGLCEQLLSYGFDNPIVFPFSANAARLFKLVVKGRELTKREQRDFGNLFERFSSFDASHFIIGAKSNSVSDAYKILKNDKAYVIKDVEYSYNSIINALSHTGILNIENWMSEEMKRR